MRHFYFPFAGISQFLFALLLSSPIFGQKVPASMRFDLATHTLLTGDQAPTGLYDESKIRTFQLWFAQADYWQQLKNNYQAKINLPATLIVEGDTFPNVGVRFKGNTSYNMIQTSDKKSFNITMDDTDPNQNLDGYETINLNNAFEDASFMREVAYLHSIRRHIPAARATYVRLFINGQNWGIYPNVEQLDGAYTKEWFFSNDGTRWRADRPPGSPGGMGGGWGDGTAGLNNLGADTAKYKQYYTLKSTQKTNPWGDLVKTCQVLNATPLANLDTAIARYLDLDRTLWFLASEIAFSDDDSYVFKGKMDYYLYWDAETGRMTPLEFDGNSCMKTNAANWGVFYNASKVNYPLLNRLLAVPSIRQRYLAHFRTLIAEEMDQTKFSALIDKYDAMIKADVQADPKKLYTYTQYTSEKQTLKTFIQTHRTTLLNDAELKVSGVAIQSASMSTTGGVWVSPTANEMANITATMASATGTAAVYAYYCPALYGNFQKTQMFDDGQHADGASGDGVYGASLPGFDKGTWVRFYVEAKASNTAGTLSYLPVGAEHDVFYYQVGLNWADSRPVVINEIMASNQTTAKDEKGQYEDWIELYNGSSESVDLSGWFLSDDLSKPDKWAFEAGTSIPANGYLIVWADEDGAQGPLHANFKLSASGESLMLLNAEKRLVDTVSFGQQLTDRGYARVPNGTGAFKIQAATFQLNNNTSSPVWEPSATRASMQVYPNPASQRVRVDLQSEGYEAPLVVMDVTGQILQRIHPQPTQDLDVSAWPRGVYFLKWGNVSTKLLVQ